jgi:hypothetical protein
MWIEVFKSGTQTDSAGNSKAWSEEDLKKIVNTYNNQSEHEAPIVIGHPDTDAPAYGWVEKLKAAGNTLFAKVKQLNKEFKELVNSGTYKKRSISLYPSLLLRHVGFLGAAPPAIKGLKDVKFEDDKTPTNYDLELDLSFSEDEPGIVTNNKPDHIAIAEDLSKKFNIKLREKYHQNLESERYTDYTSEDFGDTFL